MFKGNSTLRTVAPKCLLLLFFLLLPLCDRFFSQGYRLPELLRPIFIFAILGLGLNIVTGYTGLLNLGIAAFMAIGAYSYAIFTCDIYPFQFGFWGGLVMAMLVGAIAGVLLGLPTLRLRGDYLAIVTLGFGEIVQDSLKNLETITKGTQGINPLPPPNVFGFEFSSASYQPWYYLFLGILLIVITLSYHLEKSRIGRTWISLREDELASSCMGIPPVSSKLLSFSFAASIAALSGALYACYLGTSGEPNTYDFQISIIALCMVIVGGMGNISGVLLGALIMVGFNSIFLEKFSQFLMKENLMSAEKVYTSPNNWKYMIFGLALILVMRFKPEGLLPSRRLKEEFRHKQLRNAESEVPVP